MQYAAKQVIRPRQEGGCDYGYGKRYVLVQKGDKCLIRQDGAKHWAGNGCDWRYSPVDCHLWHPKRDHTRSIDLFKGRFSTAALTNKCETIFKFFEEEFDLALVVPHATLLLDQPGEVTEPPPKPKSDKPPVEKLGWSNLFQVTLDPDTDQPRVRSYRVTEEKRGYITYERVNAPRPFPRRASVREVKSEFLPTAQDAIQRYLDEIREDYMQYTEKARQQRQRWLYAAAILQPEKYT